MVRLRAVDVLRVLTPGGGGWGVAPHRARNDPIASLASGMQVAAYEIVSKYRGEFEAQIVLLTDQVFLAVVNYPDEESSIKAHMAIQARGVYELHSQRALSLEELLQFQAEAAATAS